MSFTKAPEGDGIVVPAHEAIFGDDLEETHGVREEFRLARLNDDLHHSQTNRGSVYDEGFVSSV